MRGKGEQKTYNKQILAELDVQEKSNLKLIRKNQLNDTPLCETGIFFLET